jgi:hypothetical protein
MHLGLVSYETIPRTRLIAIRLSVSAFQSTEC